MTGNAPIPAYAELLTTSNFSFLRSGSHPEELVSAAIHLGHTGIGICDRNSFAGVVRGYVAARDLKKENPDFRYVVGVRFVFSDGTPDIVAYPSDRAAYGRLCQLLTRGNLRGEKGGCRLFFEDLDEFAEGQLFIFCCDESRLELSLEYLDRLRRLARGRVWLGAAPTFKGNDRARLARLASIARQKRVRLLAVNDVLYHIPDRKIVQDVVTCIREHLTLETAGRRLGQNAERHLKAPEVMARLFADYPEALTETQEFLARIEFTLDQLRYNYPTETIGNGETAQETLERLTWEGAHRRYPDGIPDKVVEGLNSELELIDRMNYASYFLTVQDIVRYARHERGILCQGRGSAANSMVCYCLEITAVNPITSHLVFGRFLSTERNEPPDIDVDFEHERREEVMQYVYQKYGGTRTGLTATVICYRSKSAVRETAKVFGISDDTIQALNKLHWGWGNAADLKGVRLLKIDPDDPTITQMFNVIAVLKTFPRHLSQHVGGFVITRDSLESLVPISKTAMESRTIIEWDKDDIDALGILKVDVLALGMLTCLRRAFNLLDEHYSKRVTLDELLAEEDDPDQGKKARVYAMTHRADTIGVFQIESRAQMSMLPRLKPEKFYDLVIEVAIVRPGPIQGGMVHPYLQRRQDKETVTFPKPELAAVLGRTLGVPLFQEQAMQIAMVGAGFSSGKADQLRRAMAAWKRNGRLAQFSEEFISGMVRNGYSLEFAQRCFSQIQGFGEYGFPESHAASFALLVYASCWLKCHYPDVFACALLNSQPMGFYSPAQIVRDVIEHGVEVRPVDVNRSDWLYRLEPGRPANRHIAKQHAEMAGDILSDHAIRLGLRQITGLKEAHAQLIVEHRGEGYPSIRDLWLRTGLPIATLEKLAEADAFGSLNLSRREALWIVRSLNGTTGAERLPLFSAQAHISKPDDRNIDLPLMPKGEAVVHDYRTLTLSLKGHPLSFMRPELNRRRVLRCADLIDQPNNVHIEVAGLVLIRQQPGTASGVIFATLEDETGIANTIIWPRTFKKYRQIVLGSRVMSVWGKLQREGLVTHLIAGSFRDLTPRLLDLAQGRDLGSGEERRDESERQREERLRREAHAALPSGRNFH